MSLETLSMRRDILKCTFTIQVTPGINSARLTNNFQFHIYILDSKYGTNSNTPQPVLFDLEHVPSSYEEFMVYNRLMNTSFCTILPK
jgi:hypothetical protein